MTAPDGVHVPEAFPPGVDLRWRPVRVAWPLAGPLELGALDGAAECAALHVRALAAEWGLARLGEAAAHVAAGLVAISVGVATGMAGTPPVRLWPRSDRVRLLVAVWDAWPQPPEAPQWPGGQEWPFGAVAEQRGWHPYEGGKVTWSVVSWRGAQPGAAPRGLPGMAS